MKSSLRAPFYLFLGFLLIFLLQSPRRASAEDGAFLGLESPQEGKVSGELEILRIENLGYSWRVVSLENNYTNAIPICSYVLPSAADNPAAIQIRSITGSSFEARIQQPVDSALVNPSDVYCIVAEEGAHVLPDGRNFEAHTVVSTDVSGNNAGGWANGEEVTGDVLNSYTNPVVLGQVISANNPGSVSFGAMTARADRIRHF